MWIHRADVVAVLLAIYELRRTPFTPPAPSVVMLAACSGVTGTHVLELSLPDYLRSKLVRFGAESRVMFSQASGKLPLREFPCSEATFAFCTSGSHSGGRGPLRRFLASSTSHSGLFPHDIGSVPASSQELH